MTTSFNPGDLLLAASDVDDRNIDLRNHRGALGHVVCRAFVRR